MNIRRISAIFLAITILCIAIQAKTVRILAIGNSFSRDAIEQYLYELAAANNDTAIIGNMYIPACSIEMHVRNSRDNVPAYVYRKIGADGVMHEHWHTSLATALADDRWDYITVQQASAISGDKATYDEWLPELLAYIKTHAPKSAKTAIHQTWAYQQDSRHRAFPNFNNDQQTMYRMVTDAYNHAAKKAKIKIIIPASTAIQNARTSVIGDNMTRDGYHLDKIIGRYTAACTWYEKLFDKNVIGNSYAPANMNPGLKLIAQTAAHSAVTSPDRITDLSHIQPEIPLYKDATVPTDIRIHDLLKRMTLDEKVMQLNQYTLGRINNVNNIGQVVNDIPAEIGSMIYYDADPQARNVLQRRAMQQSRLGIPVLFGYDVIHGFRTIYPISLAQACSWNPELVRQACAGAAQESRMSGVDWTFSPMIDVARDPRWGRVAEGYGEDPYTNAIFCAASVRGYQGDNLNDSTSVAACLKHYVGYGASEAGRDYVYTEVSPQTLWDTYLPPYEAGVKAGAATLMSSFNDISGTPGSANHYTLTEILKNRWKHKGFVVSDWGAIEQLQSQGMAADKAEAAALAMNAGLEMDMMSHAYDSHLADLVKTGKVDESTINEAVKRVLRVKFNLGLFENPYTADYPDRFLRPESMLTAANLAAESMVLLKNDSTTLLPLNGKKKIAVIGPVAKDRKALVGAWSAHGKVGDVVSWYDGIVNEFGSSAEIRYAAGCAFDGNDRTEFAAAIDTARWADVVILCLGEMRHWSGENASRSSIALPAIQEELAKHIASTGTPVVTVLTNGRPLELSRLEPLTNAIIEAWQPGINGGDALGGILSGRINPSGKLAMTFPYTTGQIPIYYNRRKSARPRQGLYQDIPSQPLYPFGHGLSYTTFSYGDLTSSHSSFTRNDRITVSIPVTNTGAVEGKETVHWFIADPYCRITRPEKELKYFEKKSIKPGETAMYTFTINPMRDLSYVDSDGKRFLETGEYHVIVNDQKIVLTLTD